MLDPKPVLNQKIYTWDDLSLIHGSGGKPMSYTPQQQQQQQQPPAEMSPEDVEEFSKMFPGLDKQVIKVHLYITD